MARIMLPERRRFLLCNHTRFDRFGVRLPRGRSFPLFFQERQLVFRKIFVQQIQAKAGSECFRTGRRAGRLYRSSNASCASRTASAIAVNGMRPPQRRLQIKSHDRPSATSSKTCQTMMRVPLNVGLPWQISGSATMYSPNSTRPVG